MAEKKLKIAFLDGATVDLGDLDLGALRHQGPFFFLPNCPPGRFPLSVRKANVLITNKVVLGERELTLFPNLRLICVAATGVNNIDLEAARRRKVGVCNVAGYSTATVVEHTMMFLLVFAHRFLEHHQSVVKGRWSRSPFFALLDYPFQDLKGKTLGIIGYGTIGKEVARLAKAFGMNLLVGKIPGRKYLRRDRRVPLKTLLQKSDFVSLHCALTTETQGLINDSRLRRMKPRAFLLNLARGPVVVEKDVARALKAKRLAGYGADVTGREPLPEGHPFLQKSLAGKVLLTPHIAWASRESRQRLVDEIAANIAAFKRRKKRNRLV